MTSMTVSAARAAMLELLTRVDAGEEVTITRHGRPVAVVVRPDTLQRRRGDSALNRAGRVHDLLQTARDSALPRSSGLSGARADELVNDVEAARQGG